MPVLVLQMIGKDRIKEKQVLYLQILKVAYTSYLPGCFWICKAVWEPAAIHRDHLQIWTKSLPGMSWLGSGWVGQDKNPASLKFVLRTAALCSVMASEENSRVSHDTRGCGEKFCCWRRRRDVEVSLVEKWFRRIYSILSHNFLMQH